MPAGMRLRRITSRRCGRARRSIWLWICDGASDLGRCINGTLCEAVRSGMSLQEASACDGPVCTERGIGCLLTAPRGDDEHLQAAASEKLERARVGADRDPG